jgi:hypothetical protein
MTKNQSQSVSHLQYAHEAAFSLNVAFGCVALALLNGPRPLTNLLTEMEMSINRFFGIRQTDFITGYWEVLIPVAVLGALIWLLLYVSRQTQLARKVLGSLAGLTGLAVAPTIWLSATYVASRRYGWDPFRAPQFFEFALVLFIAIMYVRGASPKPSWRILLLVLVHFGFWFWQFNPHPFFSTYSGPVAPAIGLCSSLVWILYAHFARAVSKESLQG